MDTTTLIRRLGAGLGGALLLVALFLPWAQVAGADRNGWELLTTTDVLYAMAAAAALATALTGGHFGLFRADVSLIGLTDMLNVIATTLLIVFLTVDFPEGADAQAGVYVALVGAVIAMFAVGEYRRPPGGSWFPKTASRRPPA
jgi:hypothetical protein